jgi:hypothetical protein
MRLLASLVSVLLFDLCLPVAADAQDRLLRQPFSEETTTPTAPAVPLTPALLPESPALGQEHWVSIKPEIGWPTGFRLQATFLQRANFSLAVEGLVGIDVLASPLFAIALPVYGVGCRGIYTLKATEHDAFQINPALELFAAGVNDLRFFVGPDIELCWLHEFGKHFGVEIGLDLGLGIAAGGQINTSSSGGPSIFPILSLFSGLRF